MIELNRNRNARHTEMERALTAVIAERIKKARIEKGIDLKVIAKRLGVDRTAYYRMEQGKTVFSCSRIILLADWLGTTPHALMGWENDN